MTKTIAVIIPAYNHARFLGRCLQSVLAQTRPTDCIVVVDDGSTDGTRDVVASFGNRITYVHQVNSGVSAARNSGIAIAATDYVAFLDADDAWHPTKLERQIAVAEKTGAGFVYSGARIVDADERWIRDAPPEFRGKVFRDLLFGNFIPGSGSNPLVERRLFEVVGAFDIELSTSADWDMWLRLSTTTLVEHTASVEVIYTLSPAGMHGRLESAVHDSDRIIGKMASYDTSETEPRLFRRAIARRHRILAGHAFQQQRFMMAMQRMANAIALNPGETLYALSLPARAARRYLVAREGRS
jgi:glycosyltransferase involved in cell wall biosynthesis